MFYQIDEWKKHINSTRCYHFDASAETLFGVAKKIELLQNENIDMKNALVILDRTLLEIVSNSKGHLYVKHPILSGQNSFGFHLNFFKAFLAPKFFTSFFDYRINRTIRPYMKFILEDRPFTYDPLTNECTLQPYEDMIAKDPQSYYKAKMSLFYKRSSTQLYSSPVIGNDQKALLKNMKDIFDRKKTNYKIVISPLYDQQAISRDDLFVLKEIFGTDRVFDFSGRNIYTENYMNFYESSHYRPSVATAIMDSIYFCQNNCLK
jgi:hypothetical protein